MGKWIFKKLESPEIRGTCVICNSRPQKKVGNKEIYRAICSGCDHKLYGKPRPFKRGNKAYRKFKTNICNSCGFTSEFTCQFDVDHIDGDHDNNDLSNLQTLCANCHRLKTWINKDHIK